MGPTKSIDCRRYAYTIEGTVSPESVGRYKHL